MFSSPSVAEPKVAAPRTPGARRNFLLFITLIAISFAFWWRPLVSTVALASSNDAYTYILTIIPLSLALIYVRKKDILGPNTMLSRMGWVMMVFALVGRLSGVWNGGSSIPTLSMLELVFFWIGSIIACFGFGTFRALFFPLCFLLLVIPPPAGAINWITENLQYQSAVASTWLFHAAQVPVTRDGVVLSIPTLDIEVARECSSIRSSTILIVITLMFAELFLRSGWRKLLLVAVAIPLSVAKNAVRIFTIAELGTRVDPGYLNGKLHHNGGIVFLSLAVAVVVFLVWLLRRSESRDLRVEAG